MTIVKHLDISAPKYRIIEGRFYNDAKMVREILTTQIYWAQSIGGVAALSAELQRLGKGDDPETYDEFLENCGEFLATICDRDSGVMEVNGDYAVGTTDILPNKWDAQEFTWGYIEASMFASSVIVVQEGGDEVSDIFSVGELGYGHPHDLPTAIYNDLVAEAEWILENLAEDLVAAVHLRNWIETTGYNAVTAARAGVRHAGVYTWGDAGHDALLTREGHGTGFWDRGMPDETGQVLTEWAKSLGEGEGGTWEYLIPKGAEWDTNDMPDGELTYLSPM